MSGEVFRQWILEQRVEGYRSRHAGETRILLDDMAFLGEVNFHVMDEGPKIVAMRIVRHSDDEPALFLHCMTGGIERAREPFDEVRETLAELASDRRVSVLPCCTRGSTTTMSSAKKQALRGARARQRRLRPAPWCRNRRRGESPDVITLAPQVVPEAICVDAWSVTDRARLGAELSAHLGEEYTPDLIPAPYLNECILLGELALHK